MKVKYQAAFIVPVGAKRVLNEGGWEFKTSNRISPKICEYLISSLQLKLLESYLGLDDYVGEKMKMSVVHDAQNNVESIYFQSIRWSCPLGPIRLLLTLHSHQVASDDCTTSDCRVLDL